MKIKLTEPVICAIWYLVYGIFFAAFMAARAESVTVSNKVVMVDQRGTNNAPEVVATIAQAAATQAAVDAAEAAAKAATAALTAASNNINTAIQAVNAGEVFVYREGFVDSFASVSVMSASAAVRILGFEPTGDTQTVDGSEYKQWRITYGFNEQVGAITPILKYCPALGNTFDALDTSLVGSPTSVSSITVAGQTFPDCYSVLAWIPAEHSGFVKVYISGDGQSGEIARLDTVGGMKGGADFNGTITPEKSYRMVIKGGVVTTFQEVEP